jgi:hypothetical protein
MRPTNAVHGVKEAGTIEQQGKMNANAQNNCEIDI